MSEFSPSGIGRVKFGTIAITISDVVENGTHRVDPGVIGGDASLTFDFTSSADPADGN